MGIGSRVTQVEDIAKPSQAKPSQAKPSQANDNSADITFTEPLFSLPDLILPSTTRSGLLDFLAHRKHEDLIFNQWGLSKTHKHQRQTAINFYGPPGTGKTMAAHAIAHELNQPLIMVNYAELESKYVGETSKNITKLFELANANQAIIFFDEADAMLSRRVTNMSNATDVSVNQTRSVLLSLMNYHDGLIIFTTNFIENYDPAFMRRILAHIHFDLPDLTSRMQLWKKYIPIDLPCIIDINILSESSDGLSGSDISSCVLKAAMSAARQCADAVNLSHFQQAIEEIHRSKNANNRKNPSDSIKVEKRIVSADYVKDQLQPQSLEDIAS